MPGLLLDTLTGTNGSSRPVWLMRQAGRYLPEYRALRADKGGFLALVYDPAAATEITLQPLRRYGFDGAILFSDILIVPYAMGQDLQFLVGEGPHLSPRLLDTGLETLRAVPERLSPIYETVRQVRAALDPATTLLGFAGSHGPSPLTWWRAKAAATSTPRVNWPTATVDRSRRSSTLS